LQFYLLHLPLRIKAGNIFRELLDTLIQLDAWVTLFPFLTVASVATKRHSNYQFTLLLGLLLFRNASSASKCRLNRSFRGIRLCCVSKIIKAIIS
jgi:hypothetical protein